MSHKLEIHLPLSDEQNAQWQELLAAHGEPKNTFITVTFEDGCTAGFEVHKQLFERTQVIKL